MKDNNEYMQDYIEHALFEMEDLKEKYLVTNNKSYLETYINKLQNISNFTDVSEYLTDYFGQIIIKQMIESNIHPTYRIVQIICNHPNLFETYILHDGTNILLRAPDSVYNLSIKNKPLIEYLFENDLVTNNLITSIIGCPKIFEYMKKYNKEYLVSYMNPIDLLTKRENDRLLLDELIDSKINVELKTIHTSSLIQEILNRKAYYLLEYLEPYALNKKITTEKTFFEFLLEKDVMCLAAKEAIIYGYPEAIGFIEAIVDKNNYELLVDTNEETLNKVFKDNKTLLELLLENKLLPTLGVYKKKETAETLLKYNKYKELQKCSEELLILKVQDNKRIVDLLFERGLSVELSNIKTKEMINSIYSFERTDLYPRIQLSSLINIGVKTQSFLEYIIEQMKKDDSIRIKHIKNDLSSISEHAQICIILAQNGLIHNYPLDKHILFNSDGEKTLLEYLIEMDFNITKDIILTEELKKDKEIKLMLELNDLKLKVEESNLVIKEISEKYLNSKINAWNKEEINLEESFLLDRLYEVMNDGNCDIESLNWVIALYRHLYATNNIYANEVVHLIDIKINNPDFTFIRGPKDYFDQTREKIVVSQPNYETFNHELGHMLLYFLAEDELSEEILSCIEKLEENPLLIENTSEHSKSYRNFKKSLQEYVENSFMKKYDQSITKERIKEIEQVIEKTKELKAFIPIDYPITVEEFIKQDRKIKKSYLVDLILRVEHGYVTAISDILDAIYKGKYQYSQLVDKKGNVIEGNFGHGVDYYSRGIEWVFSEIIANYSEIIKSEHAEEGIELLRDYIGDELCDLLEKYYNNNILYSEKYSQKML